jgi:hypothetical protein
MSMRKFINLIENVSLEENVKQLTFKAAAGLRALVDRGATPEGLMAEAIEAGIGLRSLTPKELEIMSRIIPPNGVVKGPFASTGEAANEHVVLCVGEGSCAGCGVILYGVEVQHSLPVNVRTSIVIPSTSLEPFVNFFSSRR